MRVRMNMLDILSNLGDFVSPPMEYRNFEPAVAQAVYQKGTTRTGTANHQGFFHRCSLPRALHGIEPDRVFIQPDPIFRALKRQPNSGPMLPANPGNVGYYLKFI